VNRRGLGVHFTVERFSNGKLPPLPGSVYQEAIKAASAAQVRPDLPAKEKKLKLLILAGFGIVQALAVVVNSVFDFVGVLNF